jgi:hypothetical protein
MGDFVRENRIQQTIWRPENFHLPTYGNPSLLSRITGAIGNKCKTGFATRVHADLDLDWTFVLPWPKLFSKPLDRQFLAKPLGFFSDPLG